MWDGTGNGRTIGVADVDADRREADERTAEAFLADTKLIAEHVGVMLTRFLDTNGSTFPLCLNFVLRALRPLRSGVS
ncbi:MAG: hypothetical protein BGO98_27540 [Myxococcales bacterium 68-20]|nr:MAG: hypothetical protein BGO98_27540 [Myxococcales bacterium 68-20]